MVIRPAVNIDTKSVLEKLLLTLERIPVTLQVYYPIYPPCEEKLSKTAHLNPYKRMNV